MSEIKQITWDSLTVHRNDLAERLTKLNFQPGKFLVTQIPFSNYLTVTYVKSELSNEPTKEQV